MGRKLLCTSGRKFIPFVPQTDVILRDKFLNTGKQLYYREAEMQ